MSIADLRDVPTRPHDAPLREDVRRLGALVGEVLAEQGGDGLLARVEATRAAAILRRETGADLTELTAALADVPAQDAEVLARAFAAWFNAVNVAERVHRIRRRRDYERSGAAPQPESLRAVLAALKAQGLGATELRGWVEALDVELVFTAHPTEAVRRALLEKEQAVVRSLVRGFDAGRTPPERRADTERIREALTASWQTADASPVRPTVRDEVDHVGFYLSDPLYRVLPAVHEALEDALRDEFGLSVPAPRPLRFASWVGGDMDGNPNVGAATISDTLRVQRASVIARYLDECADVSRILSQTTSRVTVADALAQRLDEYRERFPDTAAAIPPRHADMPYRTLLAFMRERLRRTAQDADGGYTDAKALEADVRLIADSLAAHGGAKAGLFQVRRLLARVRCFGFHLARLDVRQDSRVHDDALAALLGDPGWAGRSADEREATLRPYASGEATLPPSTDATAARLHDVFVALADARARFGEDATGPYIISMARRAADVLAVLALARAGGLVDAAGRVPLDVAPLFETVDDLENAATTLRALLAEPRYRAHLKTRGERQVVMLGYSDSAKDGGILAARWRLQRAQVELLEVAASAGVALTFFHGRGGSASRGGGKVTPALMASPRGAVAGRLRVTQQGEVIHRKYGIRALALRELEQTVGAVLRASARPRAAEPREVVWRQQMETLAQVSREAWSGLVRAPGFVGWFRDATPIDVIERMTIGSRPPSRRSMHGVEDLRAIPWVFSWTQCRAVITGWYGLGSALEAGVQRFGEAAMRELARDWPFFATLLADVEMVLAKADLGVAEAWSRLSGDAHRTFFPRVEAEFARTRDGLLRLVGRDALLAAEPRLATSIRLRNPYIDPLSVLQIDLVRRWRGAGRPDGALLEALVACVNGVSRGLQNTG